MLAEAILSAALVLVPAERHADRPWGSETTEQVEARYASIGRDMAEVCLDENEVPIHGMSRASTCGVLLGLAVGESGLARDTDEGPCYREGAWRARCDEGRSASMWQLQVGPDGRVWRGELVTTERLFADRKLAIRVALGAVRASLGKCRHLPPEYRLSAYGAGVCVRLEGAADRWATGMRAAALVEQALASAARKVTIVLPATRQRPGSVVHLGKEADDAHRQAVREVRQGLFGQAEPRCQTARVLGGVQTNGRACDVRRLWTRLRGPKESRRHCEDLLACVRREEGAGLVCHMWENVRGETVSRGVGEDVFCGMPGGLVPAHRVGVLGICRQGVRPARVLAVDGLGARWPWSDHVPEQKLDCVQIGVGADKWAHPGRAILLPPLRQPDLREPRAHLPGNREGQCAGRGNEGAASEGRRISVVSAHRTASSRDSQKLRVIHDPRPKVRHCAGHDSGNSSASALEARRVTVGLVRAALAAREEPRT